MSAVVRSAVKSPITQQQIGEISLHPYRAVPDCVFLSLVVILSLILYVKDLGFYSETWAFLGSLSLSKDQSLAGLFRSIYSPWVQLRPAQILYLAGLYWLFGPHPIGYHLVNGAVLLSGIVLFYLVLRELGQRHLLALAVPVVYALLPHYCTDRFWVASSQANLSMALYFLSLYADLRSLPARLAPIWGWKLLSLLSLLGSMLAYEVFLPLFLLNPLLVWYRRKQDHNSGPGGQMSRAKLRIFLGSNLLPLIAVLAFKAWAAVRLGSQSGFGEHAVWFIKQAIQVSYGEYGLGLPRVVGRILRYYPDWTILAVGGVLGLFIFGYLYLVANQPKTELPSRTTMLRLIVGGLVVSGLGDAIFLITRNAQNSTTGIVNRVAIAAAVGIALSFVGALGWASGLLRSDRLRRSCFCVLVSVLCTSGFLILNTVASFWADAYRREQAILLDIRQRFPTLPPGSTLILDGICPYAGPAIVFESNWDLVGALRMIYSDGTLRGDVVTPNLKVNEDGLSTLLYGTLYTRYPYEKLFVYHIGRRMSYPLRDAEAAQRYFQTFNPDHNNNCPPGTEGYGVRIF